MSRRRISLATRRGRRTLKRRAYAAGAAFVVVAWAWKTHPLALGLTLLAASAGGVLWAVGRHERHQRRLEAVGPRPVVVYQHWFRRDLIQPYLDAGYPASWFGYTGITNDYEARCGQHAKGSWWWILIDFNLSTFETNPATGAVTWPNAYAAGQVETGLIRQRCGLGNTRDNPAYGRQTHLRESLQVFALQLHQQVLAYGRTG